MVFTICHIFLWCWLGSTGIHILSLGHGFGFQTRGELIDFIIMLQMKKEVKTFSGNIHLCIGVGISASVGPIGRSVEADLRAGYGGSTACYTYSCSTGKVMQLI